jgi:hypothetical protein
VTYLFDATKEGSQGERWGRKLAKSLMDGTEKDVAVRPLRLNARRHSFMGFAT